MGKPLVIVESPTKAKTINKFLGSKYQVESSFGHIRDLPKSKLGVDVEHDFEPTYIIPPKAKKRVAELKKLAKNAGEVILATDEDREGEAIAWHLMHALDLEKKDPKRIVFHEITDEAITEALAHPRHIDINLVDAQQARRILDRLVGYTLSPLLWKKIYRGLSAGRVQSVAVRIIAEREQEINDFKAEEYWTIESLLSKKEEDQNTFTAQLIAKDEKKYSKFDINSKEKAEEIVSDIEGATYTIESVDKKEIQRKPPIPFTTSTLQQDASRRFGFSSKQTMVIAQQLYEGIDIGEEGPTGLITYMRTDSLNLSQQSITSIREYIQKEFPDALPSTPILYKTNKKGAQEAHEAIRPSNIAHTPEKIKDYLDSGQYKLYQLIWQRTVACQMLPAIFNATSIDISAKKYTFRATGKQILKPSFLEVYPTKTEETILPPLAEGEDLSYHSLTPFQHFTQPPARYSEATLIKTLEEYGIGRPSTYAPTISTIIDRGYVVKKEDKKLHPTDLGLIVNSFLVKYFNDIVDYAFTADMEEKLDSIAEGTIKWKPTISQFFMPFEAHVKELMETAERATGDRELGKDPVSGKPVIARIGRFGPMVQIGTKEDEEKPRFAKITGDKNIGTITLEEAMTLFTLPRTLGTFEDKDVVAAIGRFGPYIKHEEKYVSIPKELDPYTITLDQSIALIEDKRKKDAEKFIAEFEDEGGTIQLLNGRYGPYIKTKEKNVRIPKDVDPAKLTLPEIKEIIEKAPPPRRWGKKPTKKSEK